MMEEDYVVACQKELRQLELQILNNISVPLDWLNAGQFDCRGLTSMGPALETPEGCTIVWHGL